MKSRRASSTGVNTASVPPKTQQNSGKSTRRRNIVKAQKSKLTEPSTSISASSSEESNITTALDHKPANQKVREDDISTLTAFQTSQLLELDLYSRGRTSVPTTPRSCFSELLSMCYGEEMHRDSDTALPSCCFKKDHSVEIVQDLSQSFQMIQIVGLGMKLKQLITRRLD